MSLLRPSLCCCIEVSGHKQKSTINAFDIRWWWVIVIHRISWRFWSDESHLLHHYSFVRLHREAVVCVIILYRTLCLHPTHHASKVLLWQGMLREKRESTFCWCFLCNFDKSKSKALPNAAKYSIPWPTKHYSKKIRKITSKTQDLDLSSTLQLNQNLALFLAAGYVEFFFYLYCSLCTLTNILG